MTINRRKFLRRSGAGLLTFYIAGCEVEMTPQEARQKRVEFAVLSETDVHALDALGEILVPGSAIAGLSHFVDHQLNATYEDTLLMIRYLGVPAPFAPFYQGGLAALDGYAEEQMQQPFAALDSDQQTALVGQFAAQNPDNWQGPPAPFFYFVLRSDAVDVVYGTRDGSEALGIPYRAHIEPPERWTE